MQKYHISGLQKILEKHEAVDLNQTTWGIGYRLNLEAGERT